MYERNLIEYLPENLREVKENHAILTMAEQPEMENLWGALDNVLKDQFIQDATEKGVSRYEAIMKIAPKADQSLDDRKFAILTKTNEQTPFTMTTLKRKLGLLCGEDGYSVISDVKNKILTVRVALTSANNYSDVETLLERIVPANMVIDLSLMYTQHYKFTNKYKHEQLEEYRHGELRNGVLE